MAGWFIYRENRGDLPRIHLSEGGEFRVFQVVYTTEPQAIETSSHSYGGAPRGLRRMWLNAPATLRRFVPEPKEPYHGSFPQVPAIGIWWAQIEAATGRPGLGPSGDALLTLDDGEVRKLHYPSPADYREGDPEDSGYRIIWIYDPPTSSRRLRLHVPVEDEAVDFEVENPAFRSAE
jgi:hypothetical protein